MGGQGGRARWEGRIGEHGWEGRMGGHGGRTGWEGMLLTSSGLSEIISLSIIGISCVLIF